MHAFIKMLVVCDIREEENHSTHIRKFQKRLIYNYTLRLTKMDIFLSVIEILHFQLNLQHIQDRILKNIQYLTVLLLRLFILPLMYI